MSANRLSVIDEGCLKAQGRLSGCCGPYFKPSCAPSHLTVGSSAQEATMLRLHRETAGVLLVICGAVRAAHGAPDAALDGYWSGWAERDGDRTPVALRLVSQGPEITGTVDWPSMGYFKTDLINAETDGATVRVSVPLPVGAIKLIGARSDGRIDGTLDVIGLVHGQWQSLGVGGAFELRRGDEPVVPYAVEDVTFGTAEATLSGSLFLPDGQNKHPAVVYIAGSGDTTRGDGSFLADRLARAGIAVLVYDKRGTGQSTGDWQRGGFDELAADVAAALGVLRRRPDIAPEKTGFVCQSQGCWVAPIALRQGAAAHFLVAQSGPGVSVSIEDLDHYRVRLASEGFGPHDIDEALDLVTKSQGVSRGTTTWARFQATLDTYKDRAWFKVLGYSPEPQDAPGRLFERNTIGYDPAENLDAIRIPSLWIYGAADEIIPVPASIDAIRRANAAPKPEIVVLPDAGHSFTIGQRPLPRMAAGYPELVIDWIKQRR
jgi:hypothetical protein